MKNKETTIKDMDFVLTIEYWQLCRLLKIDGKNVGVLDVVDNVPKETLIKVITFLVSKDLDKGNY